MSVETLTEWKDGDIFRWSYTPARLLQMRRYTSEPYWAKSRIGIVRKGFLYDTFWNAGTDCNWTPEAASEELTLTFVANMADLEKRPEADAKYYAEADIVNLNHSNSRRGNFYIRKGAKRDRTRMLETARKKLTAAESEFRSASRLIELYADREQRLLDPNTNLDEVWI